MLLIFALIVLAGWWLGHWIIGVGAGGVVFLLSPLAMTFPHWRWEKTSAVRYWRDEYSHRRGIQVCRIGYVWWYPVTIWR